MKAFYLVPCLISVVIGVNFATACPLQAQTVSQSIDSGFTIPSSTLNGLFNLEEDFFDRGRALFEAEIDLLIERQLEPDAVLLTIDDDLQFEPNDVETWEELQVPDATPTPENL